MERCGASARERADVARPLSPTRWRATSSRSGFAKRVQQAGVIEAWPELVGPQIAAVTAPESVTPDGVLRVRVATAAWANELSLMTPRILARVNDGRQGG